MTSSGESQRIDLDLAQPVWDQVFTVAPLVLIGTRDSDGAIDLAPKHMVSALSWENHFGFVCSEQHRTLTNAVREGCFTVSYPRPSQIVLVSLAAAPRDGGEKSSLRALPTVPARKVDGELLRDAYLHLECRFDRVVEFGANQLVCGRIVAAQAAADSIREDDRDDGDLIHGAPLMAYLHKGRYAVIEGSSSFPYHEGFSL